MILSSGRNNIAYTWHRPSSRFIEKPPEKRSGKWVGDGNCDFFMWADSCISPLTPAELASIKKEEKRLAKIRKEKEEMIKKEND